MLAVLVDCVLLIDGGMGMAFGHGLSMGVVVHVLSFGNCRTGGMVFGCVPSVVVVVHGLAPLQILPVKPCRWVRVLLPRRQRAQCQR
jgi:putative effector of murein hydrolase